MLTDAAAAGARLHPILPYIVRCRAVIVKATRIAVPGNLGSLTPAFPNRAA